MYVRLIHKYVVNRFFLQVTSHHAYFSSINNQAIVFLMGSVQQVHLSIPWKSISISQYEYCVRPSLTIARCVFDIFIVCVGGSQTLRGHADPALSEAVGGNSLLPSSPMAARHRLSPAAYVVATLQLYGGF